MTKKESAIRSIRKYAIMQLDFFADYDEKKDYFGNDTESKNIFENLLRLKKLTDTVLGEN